ncbi:unnamed protein product [marine sediment metagenome]|uniref:NTP pyrophosphohydrolase MazG-like domain-containing protein n=1 Tax=marine sediment metagenome TaxID=412755 RepID=X1DE53_9ZZZZ
MNESTIQRKHRFMVQDMAKKPEDIKINDLGKVVMHAALGIAGESGEVVDVVKKAVINGRPLNRIEVMKEMGDLEFYLALLRDALDIDREIVLEMNIDKLRERYPDGYSDQASRERRDVG